ncbi:MAG TPA: hypothetical protein VKE26_26360 [Xanthobacteraceae bacterium]|nr:hypothetical protein [Xanthobacteraceae bacterium]
MAETAPPLVPTPAPAAPPPGAATAPGAEAPTVAPGAAAPPVPSGAPSAAALPAPAAPAVYTVTVPADATRLVSEQDLAYLKEVARTNAWTNAELQTELDAQVGRARARRTEVISGWEATTRADADYGGTHLGDTQRLATLAIDTVRPASHPRRDRFLTFLNESGGSVHLEVVAFLADLGRLLGEDRGVLGRAGGGGERDRGATLYDHPSSVQAAEAVRQRGLGPGRP